MKSSISNQPRFSLKYKILSGILSVLILVMLLSIGYFTFFYQTDVEQSITQRQQIAKETYFKVVTLQVSRLKAVLRSILLSPRFKLGLMLGLEDAVTLEDSMRTEHELSGADLFMVADAEGKPLLGLLRGEKTVLQWHSKNTENLGQKAIFQVHFNDDLSEALSDHLDEDDVFTDLIEFREKLFRIVSTPVVDPEGNYLGLLILGNLISEDTVNELKRVTMADEIIIINSSKVLATTYEFTNHNELLRMVHKAPSLKFEFANYASGPQALQNANGSVLGYLVVMTNLIPFKDKLNLLYLKMGGSFVFALLLAIIISLYLSGRILRPMSVLAKGFEAVGSGQLDTKVHIDSNDEIEILSHTFNEMVNGLRQKETMSHFLTGMELREVEAVSDGSKQLSTKGEKRIISILFSDIRSFTSICESTDPAVIIEALNYYFDQMIPWISIYGGSLDKIIGDCIMAVFEHSDEYNGADGALNAAISMQNRLDGIRNEMRAAGMPEFYAGFGINTGLSVVGNVGNKKQLSRTVLGDPVNLAARVESLSKEGKSSCILFTESTLNHITEDFQYDFLLENTVKGKTLPVNIYEIRSAKIV